MLPLRKVLRTLDAIDDMLQTASSASMAAKLTSSGRESLSYRTEPLAHPPPAPPPNLCSLPMDILIVISHELSVRSLVRLQMTSKECQSVFTERAIWLSALHDIASLYALPRVLYALPDMQAAELRETAIRITRIDHQFDQVEPTFLHSLNTFGQPTIFPGGRWTGLLDPTKRRWTLCSMASAEATDKLIVPDLDMEIEMLRIFPISGHDLVIFVSYFDKANNSTRCHLYHYCPNSSEREELRCFFLQPPLLDCFIDDRCIVAIWQDKHKNQYAWVSGHRVGSPGVKMHLKGSTPYRQGSTVVCLDRSHLLLSNQKGVWLFPIPCFDVVDNHLDQALSCDVVSIRSCVPRFSIDWATPLVAPFIPSLINHDTPLVFLTGSYLQTLQPSRDARTWDLREDKLEWGGNRDTSLITGASGILASDPNHHLQLFKFATRDDQGLQRLERVFTRDVKAAYMKSTLQQQQGEHVTCLSYDVESGTLAVMYQPYLRRGHEVPRLFIVRL